MMFYVSLTLHVTASVWTDPVCAIPTART